MKNRPADFAITGLPEYAPSKGREPQDGKGNQNNHPYIFSFHFFLLLLFDNFHGFFIGAPDLLLVCRSHFSLEAEGPHHDNTNDPPDDLP